MKISSEGCAVCGATWGDYWTEIDGQRMFFCCEICAAEFRNMIEEVKKRTGWIRIDELRLQGDYRGRECTAIHDGSSYGFFIQFDSRGEIRSFLERE